MMSSSAAPATPATPSASHTPGTTSGRSPSSSYASSLKRVVQTFQPAGLPPAPTNPTYQILRSYSANAMVADFSGFQLTKTEAFSIIQSNIPQVAGIKFLKQGRAAEIQFLSTSDIQQAISKGLTHSNRIVPLTRCFSHESIILPITVHGLPCFPKEETYLEIQHAFENLGSLHEVKYHYHGSSNIRMDSCTVILDISMQENGTMGFPRQIRIHGAPCDLYWRDAPAFCRYCKEHSHTVKNCPILQCRKQKENSLPTPPIPVENSLPIPPIPMENSIPTPPILVETSLPISPIPVENSLPIPPIPVENSLPIPPTSMGPPPSSSQEKVDTPLLDRRRSRSKTRAAPLFLSSPFTFSALPPPVTPIAEITPRSNDLKRESSTIFDTRRTFKKATGVRLPSQSLSLADGTLEDSPMGEVDNSSSNETSNDSVGIVSNPEDTGNPPPSQPLPLPDSTLEDSPMGDVDNSSSDETSNDSVHMVSNPEDTGTPPPSTQ